MDQDRNIITRRRWIPVASDTVAGNATRTAYEVVVQARLVRPLNRPNDLAAVHFEYDPVSFNGVHFTNLPTPPLPINYTHQPIGGTMKRNMVWDLTYQFHYDPIHVPIRA